VLTCGLSQSCHPIFVTSSCRSGRLRTSIGGRDYLRIANVTESFLPDVSGVASAAMRVAEDLAARGHHPVVIAPDSGVVRPRYSPV